jgi:hypothetical protein
VERRDVHDAWSAWKAMTDPDHESIQPVEQLDAGVQREDEPFIFRDQSSKRLGETGKA